MLTNNLNVKTNNNSSTLKSPDLKIRTYQFSLDIIKFVSLLSVNKVFWSIGDQLLRSGTSIGANIVEAQASSSRRDFIKFYQIALKSANETSYWLSLIRDSYSKLEESCNSLITEAKEIESMLGKSLITLKAKEQDFALS